MSVVTEGGGNFRDTPTRGEGEGRYETCLGEWDVLGPVRMRARIAAARAWERAVGVLEL